MRAERGSQNEQRSVGRAEAAGAALEGAVEGSGVGEDGPRSAGFTETSRAWRPSGMAGADAQASGECEGWPRHGQTDGMA